MARWLRQSTSVDVPIGPFLDDTDGKTAETALTLTQPDIRLKKNGGAWAQKAAAQTLSHEENGYYEVTLDATDTNTLGLLRLAVVESGALPVWEDFLVVPAHVWDAFFAATSWGEAIARGTLQSATSTTAVLASATSFADDLVIGATLVITGGTGAGQSRVITDWVNSTDTATVDTWTTTPDSTSTYAVYPTAPGSATLPMKSDMVSIAGSAVSTSTAQLGVNVVNAGGTAWGSGAITAASIATDAITAAKLAADAGAEIAAAVQTSAAATPLPSDIKKVNGTTVNGNGAGTPWGP